MNAAHVHLMLNHVPVLGIFFAAALLLAGAWRRSDELRRAGLATVVLAALFAMPVFLTGEPAEDVAKKLAGVTKTAIGGHEEAAEAAFAGLVGLGVFALGGLVLLRRRSVPNWLTSVVLAASLVVGGMIAWAAKLGGEIRHTELQSAPAVISALPEGPPAATAPALAAKD